MRFDEKVFSSNGLIVTVTRRPPGRQVESLIVRIAWDDDPNDRSSTSAAAQMSLRVALEKMAPGKAYGPLTVAERHALDVQLQTGGRHLLELGRIAVAVRKALGPRAFAVWLTTDYPGEEGAVIDLMGIASESRPDPASALGVMAQFSARR